MGLSNYNLPPLSNGLNFGAMTLCHEWHGLLNNGRTLRLRCHRVGTSKHRMVAIQAESRDALVDHIVLAICELEINPGNKMYRPLCWQMPKANKADEAI